MGQGPGGDGGATRPTHSPPGGGHRPPKGTVTALSQSFANARGWLAQSRTTSAPHAVVSLALFLPVLPEALCDPLTRRPPHPFSQRRDASNWAYLTLTCLQPLGGYTPVNSSTSAYSALALLGVVVSSMASGLDASSLHPTSVALAPCSLEQRRHQRLESPVPLVLR